MYRVNKEEVPIYCSDPFSDGCHKEAKYLINGIQPMCENCADDCFGLDETDSMKSSTSESIGCWTCMLIILVIIAILILFVCCG
jgi:hypothetical protein